MQYTAFQVQITDSIIPHRGRREGDTVIYVLAFIRSNHWGRLGGAEPRPRLGRHHCCAGCEDNEGAGRKDRHQ